MFPQNSSPPGGGTAPASAPAPHPSAVAVFNASSAPALSLPKGGGAIRGMGEKFTSNPLTGTGSMTVPIPAPPGRSGFGPQLSLSYDSGSGNGPFGLGWSLSLPSITRKTDKGLPRYLDDDESDVFILSGAEDLVPEFAKDTAGHWVFSDGQPVVFEQHEIITTDGAPQSYLVGSYRPRVEGLFNRIERWTRTDGDVHWRCLSRDNVLTVYGKDTTSRIADPRDPTRVFSWLICETRDDKGNAVIYEYKPEDGTGVDSTRPHERNRGAPDDPRRGTNRYPKRIRYGNHVSLLDATGGRPTQLAQAQIANAGWMFEVVFDYGDHDTAAPTPRDDEATSASGGLRYPWPQRQDPFSSYRAGFEVRTNRLCQRVLMFHHFPDEAGVGADCLVRSIELGYSHADDPGAAATPIYSMLLSTTQTGYKRADGVGYLSKSLPTAEYEYSQPVVQDTLQEVDPRSLDNLPTGLDGAVYRWIDLHGEGLPGILSEQAGAWFYKPNVSPLPPNRVDGHDGSTAAFGPIQTVAATPSVALDSGAQFMDLAGDGRPDLVMLAGPTPGFYEHDDAQGWEPFRPFVSGLNRDAADPSVRFIDIDGDGLADLLISENDRFVWHASLGEEGFGPASRVAQEIDEERGPHLVFAEATQSVYLADLSGDGLTDLVRIRNGEICYWPNLGYGRFGAKVTMDDAPYFDSLNDFDPRRIRLADIDGGGTTDIIYLHRDGVRLYFNQSGNSWSAPQPLAAFPGVEDVANVMPVDLLGNGTACLVWSSPLAGDARRQMRFVDLMGGQKPHLLTRSTNNLGAETVVRYTPSTMFYLQDQQDGKPWITRLPFPVHVVEQVETLDQISRSRLVTRYRYHHGYFDGAEREFRGFGMVEQMDTEEFAETDAIPAVADNVDAASTVPPVFIKTWLHTGAFISGPVEGEYYREPGLSDEQAAALLLNDTILPAGLTADESREAARALKGSMLRQEVYALDGTDEAATPYSVAEQNFTVELLQPQLGNRHAVFFSHPRESLTYDYERDPSDPRVQHVLTLQVDGFGNTLKAAGIGYGRRQTIIAADNRGDAVTIPNPGLAQLDPQDQAKQSQMIITYTENDVTNAIDTADAYRTPLPAESRVYELTGVTSEYTGALFGFGEWTRDGFGLPLSATEIPYEQTPDHTTAQKRLIQRVRTLYRKNDLTALLPVGQLESLAVPGESYKLAVTPGLLTQVFDRTDGFGLDPADILAGPGGDHGGYVDIDGDGHLWSPSGRLFYSPTANAAPAAELAFARAHFFLPHRYRDPFHTDAVSTERVVIFDGYDLLMVETRDPLGGRVTVGERSADGQVDPTKPGNDYRVLQPVLMMDPNRNRTALVFDALGLVAATAVMGKPEEVLGDSLTGFDADLSQDQIDAFHDAADPHLLAATYLKDGTTRTVYDLIRFSRSRQTHPDDPARWEAPYAAKLARETHASDPLPAQGLKIQIGFSYSDGFGREIQHKMQAEPGPAPQRAADGQIIVGADGQPVMTANPVSPRWVGSGWTVFNNKGKPVRQYEPFFTDTHHFEFDMRIGVSRVLCYDPVERVVAALHPNHSWEKIVVHPWRQEASDVNDTVLVADPAGDADVGDFFHRLPYEQYLPTWYARRQSGALGAQEQAAAIKAAAHAGTPDITHLDTLGRPFLSIAHNKFDRAGNTVEELHASRLDLDVDGNQRAVRDAAVHNGDAMGHLMMRYDYNLAGERIHQVSMDAGERWLLNDVAGNLLCGWDSRDHQFRNAYDPLRRPTDAFLKDGAAQEILVGRSVYGDTHPDPEADNLHGKLVEVYDQAGVVVTDGYDFKGNVLRNQRHLAQEYKTTLDWSTTVALEPDTYVGRLTYDALNRPIQVIAPHRDQAGTTVNVVAPIYNEANLLEQLHAWLNQSAEPSGLLDPAGASLHAIADVDYDAKGQRELVEYGNGVRTTYGYDPETFRLARLTSQRASDQATLQDLAYTYDPAGNVTFIRDDAQQTIFFNNRRVEPSADYTYDAIYRLIEATGREHLGQAGAPVPYSHDDAPRVGLPHPGDGNAMGTYLERYVYDAVGNFLSVTHATSDPANPGWMSTYAYNEPSPLEPGKQNNRLTGATTGAVTDHYTYDAHGNTTGMPHLAIMAWDYRDRLQATAQQVVSAGGTPETTYYVYDTSGQRVRKVTERQQGSRKQERIYLGGFEVYREYDGLGSSVNLERQSLHLMDDKQRIALVETRTVNAVADTAPPQLVRYQYGNHLGSACLELDEAAQIISYEEYSPYGGTTYQAVRSQTETPKQYRYTGKERDEESGLNYHGARYYVTWRGRWVSCDPLGIEGGFNLYGFSRNNPIGFTDPNGLQPDPWNVTPTQTAEPPINAGEAPAQWSNPHPEEFQAPGATTTAPWQYVDENWNYWAYVTWEQPQWTQHWVQLQDQPGKYAWIGEYKNVQVGQWFPLKDEVIHITGSAPKDEPLPWYHPWNLVKLGVELWSPTGKAKWVKWGLQFGISYIENGNFWDAAQEFTINGVKKKGISVAAKVLGGVLADYLGGKNKIPTGTNLALGLTDQDMDKFAESQKAITVWNAYDSQYIGGKIGTENQLMAVFNEITTTFVDNGGRIKFNLTGLDPNYSGPNAGRATVRELGRILTDPTGKFFPATDFFLNGQPLQNEALKKALEPWRKQFAQR
jgi:RHS repeat-associated protein